LLHSVDVLGGDIGDQQVLPDGEAEFSGAESVGDLGDGAHLFNRKAADGDGDADVVEAGLRLRVDADVSVAVDGAARFALGGGDPDEREGEEFFRSPGGIGQRPSGRGGI
jgi:hypothetical protein